MDPSPISIVAGETVMEQPELVVMTPLIHFLQLLCENHNNFLQVRKLNQLSRVDIDLHVYVYTTVCKTLRFIKILIFRRGWNA